MWLELYRTCGGDGGGAWTAVGSGCDRDARVGSGRVHSGVVGLRGTADILKKGSNSLQDKLCLGSSYSRLEAGRNVVGDMDLCAQGTLGFLLS